MQIIYKGEVLDPLEVTILTVDRNGKEIEMFIEEYSNWRYDNGYEDGMRWGIKRK